MPERILILTNNIGGLFSFRKEVVKAIVDAGYEVSISKPDDDERVNYFKSIGCQIIDTPFNRRGKNPFADLKLMFTYLGIIRKIKPLAVLTYTIKPNIYGGIACRLASTPQIANVTGLGDAIENGGWLQKLTVFLYKLGVGKASTVFFQNTANLEFCRRHKMVKGPMRLIPGSGVNLQYHHLQDYPDQDQPLIFLFISRLLREKGIDEYLEAAKAIKAKYPSTEFHILGSSEENYEERLMALEKEGVVVYHGQRQDVRPYIGRSCCVVHPSYYPEGMSNVLLESCAAGRPIITTDRPGCGEIVDDGVNGFVVKQRDSFDLEQKIDTFIKLPYENKRQMGLAARKKVEEEFDRNIVVEAYIETINSLKN